MLSPLSNHEAAYTSPELSPATSWLLWDWAGSEETLISAHLPCACFISTSAFQEDGEVKNHRGTQEDTQNPKAPTRAAPHHESPVPLHCLNKGKLRNVPVAVATTALWHLFCLYRLVGFNYFLKKSQKVDVFCRWKI